ncbi:carbohydrate phosphatase, partial [Morchella conica CCBAS932]
MAAYATERRIAELAVQRACLLTDKVYHSRVKGTVTKGDKSPVTIADFGAQALVIGAVHTVFPADSIVGEEDAEVLRSEADKRESVWSLVQSAVDDSAVLTADIGAVTDAEEMMGLIDLGNHAGGSVGRIWALDPIDGTKGFLRGDQYAVCLALIVDGSVQVGALGCPNLPVDPAQPEGEKGI